MDFYLSSKSLKQIKESGIEEDFSILIFDENIKCSKFVSLFISEEISQQYRVDPTIDHFSLEFSPKSVFYSSHEELKNMIQQTNFIHDFKNLLNGSPIHIKSNIQEQQTNTKNTTQDSSLTKTKLLFEFGKLLKNEEMIESSLKNLGYSTQMKEITNINDKIISFMKIIKDLGYTTVTDQFYDTIASNFQTIFCEENEEGIDNICAKLKEMSLSDLEKIISSSELIIESEDWLFEIITSLGKEFICLYDYIDVQYLSVENVTRLIENIENYEISLHRPLWASICRRLILDVSQNKLSPNPRVINKQINCEEGIFNYLEKTTDSEFYDSKAINIETSQINNGEIKNMFDHSKSTDFRVRDSNNSFIIFDFKDKKINLTKYYFSVPDSSLGHTGGQLKTWLIEGSNDKNDWETIDKRENDTCFNNYGASNTFTIENNNNKYYRFIRIKEIIDHYNSHYILLSEIEFYGSILLN